MSLDHLREVVSRLATPTTALAALAAAIDARIEGTPLAGRIAAPVAETMQRLGVESALQRAAPAELVPLLAEVRTVWLAHTELLFAASRAGGWHHDERALLEAAGEVSIPMAELIASAIAAQEDGLRERLATPGATFLDVGVGVAALSIAMARRFAQLRIVGIDPWGPALALARERIDAAGLAGRIELREQAGEDLRDEAAFDLAWIPSAFVPADALPSVVARVSAALHPGGWLIVPVLRAGDDPLAAASLRLRIALFGGFHGSLDEVDAVLREHFATVRTLPARPNALAAMIVARR